MVKNEKKKPSNGKTRNALAIGTLIFSGSAIIGVALIAIIQDKSKTMTIFNTILPVFASWVGTILAFYFGQKTFDTANQQVNKIIEERLTTKPYAEAPVTSIMRSLASTVYLEIPKEKGDKDITLSELHDKFRDDVHRLPVVDAERKPKYMIHESSIDKYVTLEEERKLEDVLKEDTLEKFISTMKKAGFEFGLNKGFVVVSEQTTLATAKRKMEGVPPCQDIFITKEGSSDEPLTGWISNLRLAKVLKT